MVVHEAFWSVVGTAGPVLVLANVVALVPAADTARAIRGPVAFAVLQGLPRWRRILAYYSPAYRNAGDVSYFLAMVGFAVNFVVTAAAVHTLGGGAGRGGSTGGIEMLLNLGFALLLAQVGTTILAKRKAKDAKRARRPRRSGVPES